MQINDLPMGSDVKLEVITSKQSKSEENTRTSSSSAADLSSIRFRYICTVKQIQGIIQILNIKVRT